MAGRTTIAAILAALAFAAPAGAVADTPVRTVQAGTHTVTLTLSDGLARTEGGARVAGWTIGHARPEVSEQRDYLRLAEGRRTYAVHAGLECDGLVTDV